VNTQGQIVYAKGDDHIIDADRCALLAHYLDTREPLGVSNVALPMEVVLF
jgi:hypothetical protein